jgi:cell division protein FtsB
MAGKRKKQGNIVPLPRKQRGGSRRFSKIRFRHMFLGVFLLWAAYVFLVVQMPELARLQVARENEQKQLDALSRTREQLKQQIADLQNDEYVSMLARKYYYMAKPGEILFVNRQP